MDLTLDTIAILYSFEGYSIDSQCKLIDWFLRDLDAFIEMYLIYVLFILLIYLFLWYLCLYLLILLFYYLLLLLLLTHIFNLFGWSCSGSSIDFILLSVIITLLFMLPVFIRTILFICCHYFRLYGYFCFYWVCLSYLI